MICVIIAHKKILLYADYITYYNVNYRWEKVPRRKG